MVDHSAQSQYAAAARVPLIKSPAVRVPPPVGPAPVSTLPPSSRRQVQLPPDIHPLPDSVTPYFAYPFILEPQILSLESSRRQMLATHTARRESLLRSREDEKEQRRREALRRVAPGFDGHGTPLEPVRAEKPPASGSDADPTAGQTAESRSGVDVMDELVNELEKMAAAKVT